MLRVDAEPSPEEMAALDPFVRENMVSLGERLNDTPMGIAAGEPDWTLPDPETLSPEWAPYETLSITVRIVDTGAADLLVRVGVTEDLLIAVGASRSKAETPVAVPKPPRLGPCHVDVRAVGDRVTMSVADCTRSGDGGNGPGMRRSAHISLSVELTWFG